MESKVLLRDSGETISVLIGDERKPVIQDYIREKWQDIITIVADLLEVPAGLIMEISESHMNVFLKSKNEENPYPSDGKDTLLKGLYCETVIGTDNPLHIANSLNNEKWKDNPDVELNMVSYYGLPIKWSDGSFFGTICALDNKTNKFETKYRKLMMYFKEIIERDLLLVEQNHKLQIETDYDALTGVYNRRKFDNVLGEYFEEYKRYFNPFTLIMIDLNSFKYINDNFGHVEGDKVLKYFSESISNRIRKTDNFFRYGGDEFAFLTKLSETKEIEKFIEGIRKTIYKDKYLKKLGLDFACGYKIMSSDVESIEQLINNADKELYLDKKIK